NSLARVLIKNGVKKESIVGILAEKSIEMIIGLMAILKAGGAFLPIDPQYPNRRINYMLEDSGSEILLVQNRRMNEIDFDGSIINLDNSSLYVEEQRNLGLVNREDNLAYVIYTSGTTGRPKGVLVNHFGVGNLKSMFENDMQIKEDDKIVQFASVSFDASVWEISMALLNGAELHILSDEVINNYIHFEEYINYQKITVATLPPVYVNNINIDKIKTLRLLVTAGSQINKKLLGEIANKIEYINAYGPTETTICSTMWKYEDNIAELYTVPIGKPIRNLKAYIVGKNNELLPIGVSGELCISGGSLARGYLNKEELTSEKFIDNPFEPRTKMYRTGDLARWMPDGNIEYLGRIDNQVKIRGYRIEIGEIEYQLLKLEGIKEAVIVDKSNENGEKYLCAYVTAERKVFAASLREKLTQILPAYMIPSFIIQIDQLPLTPNGKIDREALTKIKEIKQSDVNYEAPRTDVEEVLVRVWTEVLQIEHVGISDNYYELGGDSIKAILIVSRLQKYNLSLEVQDILQHPKIKEVSKYVKKYNSEINQGPVEGKAELSPIQNWFFENDFSHVNHFNQAFMFHIKEGINEKILIKTFENIIKHHDVFRMIYVKEKGVMGQENRGLEAIKDAFTLDTYDLNSDKDYINTIDMLVNQIQQGMDLESGVLIKLGLFKTIDGDYLFISVHHMIIDGVSWRILLEDLEQTYRFMENAKEVIMPKKTTSYKEWTRKLVEFANGEKIKKELDYWIDVEKTEVAEIPRDFNKSESTFGESKTITINITKELTEKLLRKANAAYHTQINDLLLCSLAMAIEAWSGNNKILISLEGHGRENLLKDVSIDRTIGWFTSLYPVILDMKHSEDISYCIKKTKEHLRRIPNKGVGYGILKYLTAPGNKKNIHFKLKPEIGFNYLGEFTQHNQEIFCYSELSSGTSVSLSNKKLNPIEINGLVINGQLKLEFNYSTKEFKDETIEKLTELYINKLVGIIEHCENKEYPEKTPSDYGDKELSIEDLNKILFSGKEIEKIHSLTPMQNGMLYHSLLDPYSQAYFEQITFSLEGKLDIQKLNTAFNMLIEKYEILRTAFFYEDISMFKQIVLRERKVTIHYEDISKFKGVHKEEYIEYLKRKDRNNRFDLTDDCLIRIFVIKTDGDKYKLLFSFHHIIMDGWCMSLLMNDIIHIYKSLCRGEKVKLNQTEPYSNYLEWLDNQDTGSALDYWRDYLNEYEQEVEIPRFN
ncbi:amino acid adenylation domain-containing protein, partial [Bacillus thuringiensis]|nr:amino acid adenylation domain-containing protein [Bacillus thuringiensis]